MLDTPVGAWTPYHTLSLDDRKVFEQATKGLVGVSYRPLEVSTQVVAGTNYRYKCEASPVTAGGKNYPALVEIFKPLEGPAYITQITKE